MPVSNVTGEKKEESQKEIMGFLWFAVMPPEPKGTPEPGDLARVGGMQFDISENAISYQYLHLKAPHGLGNYCRKITGERTREAATATWFLTKDAAGKPEKIALTVRTWTVTVQWTTESRQNPRLIEEHERDTRAYQLRAMQGDAALASIDFLEGPTGVPTMENPEVCLALLGKVEDILTESQTEACLDVLRGRIDRFRSLGHARKAAGLENVLALAKNARLDG